MINKIPNFLGCIIIKCYEFFNGIKNLIYWFSIIWRDKDYDQNFLFKILRHKLIKQEKYFRKNDISKHKDLYANDMKECILLIDRIIKNDYCSKEFSEYKKFEKDTKKIHKIFKKEAVMLHQDTERLFKIMTKKINTWWI